MTNPNQLYYPYFGYVNYIVANYNAERNLHAEETIGNRFEEVLSGFRERNGADPAAMLLYTYYYPCGDCAKMICSKLDIEITLHLVFSEYSKDWTDTPLIEAIIFDHSFVHMDRVCNPSHRPPEELSSSDEDTSETEEELLEMVEDFRRRDRARGRGRWSMRECGRFAVRGRGGGNFRGGFRGRFMRRRGRGHNSRGRARGYRGRRW